MDLKGVVIPGGVPAAVGEALIRSLREYAALIHVLSARFRRGLSAQSARRLGVKKVLRKPLTRKELLAAVRESVES